MTAHTVALELAQQDAITPAEVLMHEQASSRVRGKATLRAAAALGVAVLALVAACSLDMLGPVKPFRSIVASQDTHVAALETVQRVFTTLRAASPDDHLPTFRRCA